MEAIIEFLASLVGFIISLVVGLLFSTFFALCQATAGILYPTKSQAMAVYQRAAVASLIIALPLFILGAVATLMFNFGWFGLSMLVVGALAALTAGWFGRLAEMEFKRCSSK